MAVLTCAEIDRRAPVVRNRVLAGSTSAIGDLNQTFALSKLQIQPTKVITRKGYPKNGSGFEIGNNCSPKKILIAVIAKRIDAATPDTRTQIANSRGMLMSKRAVAHRAVPAAKAGTLSAKFAAVPDRITPSPIANTRKPAETRSFPFRKNLMVSKAQAITRPEASIAQKVLLR